MKFKNSEVQMMNISTERLQELADYTVYGNTNPITTSEGKTLAKYALDAQTLPDKWREDEERMAAYYEGCRSGNDCADELDYVNRHLGSEYSDL